MAQPTIQAVAQPPPYQATDPLKPPEEHFKKFTKNKRHQNSSSPLHSPAIQKSQKNAFLYQVPTPANVPKHKATRRATAISMPDLSVDETADTSLQPSPLNRASSSSPLSPQTKEKTKSSIFSFMLPKTNDKAVKKPDVQATVNEKPKKLKTVRVLKQPKTPKNKVAKETTKPQAVERHKSNLPQSSNGVVQSVVTAVRAVPLVVNDPPLNDTSLERSLDAPSKRTVQSEQTIQLDKPLEHGIDTPSVESKTPPIPKQRTILNLTSTEHTPSSQIASSKQPQSPSSPSDNEPEDTWNLVAKHRQNTQTMAKVQAAVKPRPPQSTEAQKNPLDSLQMGSRITIEQLQQSKILQQKRQIDMINKPKTMREMKKDQMQRQGEQGHGGQGHGGKEINFTNGKKEDSDTEA